MHFHMQAVARLAAYAQSMPDCARDQSRATGLQQPVTTSGAACQDLRPTPYERQVPATSGSAAAAHAAPARKNSWAMVGPAGSEDLSADDWLVVAGGATAW